MYGTIFQVTSHGLYEREWALSIPSRLIGTTILTHVNMTAGSGVMLTCVSMVVPINRVILSKRKAFMDLNDGIVLDEA